MCRPYPNDQLGFNHRAGDHVSEAFARAAASQRRRTWCRRRGRGFSFKKGELAHAFDRPGISLQ